MSPEPEDATTSSAFQAPGPTVSTPSTSSTPSPSTQDAALQAVQKLASFDDDEEVQTLQYQRALDMVRAQSNLLNHGGRNPDHPQLEQSGPLDADGLIIEESSDGMSIDVQVPSIDAPTSQASTTNEADGEGLRAARKGVMNYLLEPLEQLRNIEKYKGSGCFQDDGLFYCPECPEYWHNPSWLHKNRFKLKAGLLRHLKMVHTEWTTLERDAAYKTPEGNETFAALRLEDELWLLDRTDCPDKSTTVDARILRDISTVMKMEKRICLAIKDEEARKRVKTLFAYMKEAKRSPPTEEQIEMQVRLLESSEEWPA
ncbi:hypothetical protein GGX14DRAFT_554377 [Mycena pura]|uniref:Uncharacterized protein n=1 Tax=Mycena pura TaxID=153505 RepID=A0AAD6YSE3_9AGAR|nr:hypothetical protein GGX14DRAFT_554377 [Mycena pura]